VWNLDKKTLVGANRITQATPANFLTTFVTTLWEIFLKYSRNTLEKLFEKKLFFKNHIILLRFMLKFWPKNHFQKNSNPFTSPLLLKSKHYNV
jgi:hypothetical protein